MSPLLDPVRPSTTLPRKALLEIRRDVLAHLASLKAPDRRRPRYRFSPSCVPTLWATAFAVEALFVWGALDELPREERDGLLAYLRGGQDEKTGLFLDPAFRPEDRRSAMHTDELLHWHSSTFIAGAIRMLGGAPLHPVPAIHFLREPGRMGRWLESLPWDISPWVVGNWTYDAGCLLAVDYEATRHPANLDAMREFFRWHEARQIPETGWWDLTGKAPVSHQQYGGYHTLMVYWMYDRPAPRPEAMVRSSLSLQAPEGHYGGACTSDMDVIDAVATLTRQCNLAVGPVHDSLARAQEWLLGRRVPGGGFFDRENVARDEFGWKECAALAGEADPCSDFFRGFSLALCQELLGGADAPRDLFAHHGLPVHGVRPRSLLAPSAPRSLVPSLA